MPAHPSAGRTRPFGPSGPRRSSARDGSPEGMSIPAGGREGDRRTREVGDWWNRTPRSYPCRDRQRTDRRYGGVTSGVPQGYPFGVPQGDEREKEGRLSGQRPSGWRFFDSKGLSWWFMGRRWGFLWGDGVFRRHPGPGRVRFDGDCLGKSPLSCGFVAKSLVFCDNSARFGRFRLVLVSFFPFLVLFWVIFARFGGFSGCRRRVSALWTGSGRPGGPRLHQGRPPEGRPPGVPLRGMAFLLSSRGTPSGVRGSRQGLFCGVSLWVGPPGGVTTLASAPRQGRGGGGRSPRPAPGRKLHLFVKTASRAYARAVLY